jgi:asparagine synthase (glutamine-hydrolysing)
MSAFAAIFRLDEGPVPRPLFERLLAALDHRGHDGRNIVWHGPRSEDSRSDVSRSDVSRPDVSRPGVPRSDDSAGRFSAALGCQHFWTTPEDRGETQPIAEPESGVELLFDGRLDNRAELEAALVPPPGAGDAISDGRLALLAFRRWGRRCFERLLGPFAMVVYEPQRRRVVCARDALGDRTLYYHLAPDQLLIASEVDPLLRHPAVGAGLDEVSLARFLAVLAPLPGATFFTGVREVPPGHFLALEDGRRHLERYWSPEDAPAVRYRRDGDYVEHFRALLTDSVRCRLRSPSPPAVLMSGGLDSTSVAALAASELERAAPGQRLRSISWVFDELEAADERPFIDPMAERFRLDERRIPGDGEWPLRDLDSWPVPADAPWQPPYCRLQHRAYAAAREAGTTALLTGEFGDHLYDGEVFWLRDLAAEGRWAESWRGIRSELGKRPLPALARQGLPRSAVARLLGWPGRPRAAPRWLTPDARRRVVPAAGRTAPRRGSWTPNSLDPLAAHAVSLEVARAGRSGVDVRRPYRDRRLVELMLSIPAHLVYRPEAPERPANKWILRRAMAGILPEEVRRRRHVSTLLPLARRGLVEREAETVARLLGSPQAVWRRYVRADWLGTSFPRRLAAGVDGAESLVPWQCLCIELWASRYRGLESGKLCQDETA